MTSQKNQIITFAGILTIVAGFLHLLPAAYTHYSPFPPLETIFFVALGVAQIVWGKSFMNKPSERRYQLCLALNGGTAFFWILTRALPAPFHVGPEHVDVLGSFVFTLELAAVISLLFWEETIGKKHIIKNTFFAAIVILLVGGALYESTNALEIAFPDREVSHGHNESEKDNHTDEEPHDETEPHDDGDSH